MNESSLRGLPSVDELVRLARERDHAPVDAAGHELAVAVARATVDSERTRVLGGSPARGPELLAEEMLNGVVAVMAPSLRPVVNATGVILQTNLGRAPLSEAAIEAMSEVSRGYSNLEYDVGAGARGSRHDHVRELLRRVTGAEDGIVVNNNAAALLMVLMVFAKDREVVVSRGQAVEIGGGFRIPDVLLQSGARLVEVGTTNRTYARDYAGAISENTGALLRVHSSNFRVVGFTAAPTLAEMTAVARGAGVLLIDDLGSGCLLPTESVGLEHEPTVQESLAAGADLVLFSGDKLLGGPQAGIIVGDAGLIETLRKHPLARALRVDKLTIAALNATLQSYARGKAKEEVPLWRMLSADPQELDRRAAAYAGAAEGGRVVLSRSMVGGGSLPGGGIESPVAVFPLAHATAASAALRRGNPPVITRIEDDALMADPRTVREADDVHTIAALKAAIG